jgi:hypothetical protein
VNKIVLLCASALVGFFNVNYYHYGKNMEKIRSSIG